MSHTHTHTAHGHAANKKVLAVSFTVIASFMAVEAVGGWLSGSLALLSDAGHMFSDAFALGAALLAFKVGEKTASVQKTFGYKRFEILTAAFNGITLLVIALLICYEAALRLSDPPATNTAGMLAVSILGLAANLFVAWYMHKGDTHGNINLRGAYLHVLGDLFGSVGAITAAVLMMAFGWQWADPLAGVVVAVLIAKSGWGVVAQAVHILMEGAPENLDTESVAVLILNSDGVESVHDVHVWTISSGINMLSCHIVVDGGITVAQAEQTVYRIEHELRQHGIAHATIQVESGRHPHGNGILCSGVHPHEHGH